MRQSRAPPGGDDRHGSIPSNHPNAPSGKDTHMSDFIGHFFISLMIVSVVTLMIMLISDAASRGIKHTVDDRFQKLEERLREQLKHERESEGRQRDHEERLRQIREGGASVGAST